MIERDARRIVAQTPRGFRRGLARIVQRTSATDSCEASISQCVESFEVSNITTTQRWIASEFGEQLGQYGWNSAF